MYALKNITTISTLLLVTTLQLVRSEWPAMIERYRHTMNPTTYELIKKQYVTFYDGFAPVIADTRIKNIPINECGERLVDIATVNNARIRVMEGELLNKAHYCPEDIDPRAVTHSCIRHNVYEALLRMITILDELAPAFGYEHGELEIHLFEGLRDIATQKTLFDTLLAKIKHENPHFSYEDAYAETSKFVSPYLNNVPVHSTGAALDIHLWSNKQQEYCSMGRFNSSKDGAPTFSEGISEQQKLHRLMLLIAATQAGLTNYVYEFWHFSYGDRYACYWRGDTTALYGSV